MPTTLTSKIFYEVNADQKLKVGLAKIFWFFAFNDFSPQILSE
jgi:hypothetical protein